MLFLLFLSCCLLLSGAVLAQTQTQLQEQTPIDGYYPYAEAEERTPVLLTDSLLFYRAVQTAPDLYGATADFDLPQVALARRGEPWRSGRSAVEGLPLPYRCSAVLRLLGARETRRPGTGMLPGIAGLAGGVRSFGFDGELPLLPYYVSVRLAGRNYRVGARVAAVGELGKGWSGAVAADARTGRDLLADGVFTHALTAGFRMARRVGERYELALLAVVPCEMRGTRLSSVEEAFTLTGDRLYNPAWGFQNGKVRNSRVRRELVPLTAATLRCVLTPATDLAAAVGAEFGERSYSALGWYDARTPMPDNYRYLPSYTDDRTTEEAWRTGDPRFTQIDWDGLIERNRMAGGPAVYALEDRVERLCRLGANALFTTRLDERLTLRYGASAERCASRYFKRMRDLLGAEYIVDIDQYLVDDDTFGNRLQNDLRHPDRTIRTGDRFGYDYELHRRELRALLQVAYASDRWQVDAAAEFGTAAIFRRGRCEKELFPGSGSWGDSRHLRFAPWTLKLSVGRAFSPRCRLGLSLLAAAAVPDAAALFFQPLYNNRTVDDPQPERRYAAEADFRLTGPRVELQLTAYASAAFDGVQSLRYFDDLAGRYCDLSAAGIGRMALGAEASAVFRLSYRWRLSLAASAGRCRYIRDPLVVVVADADNTAVESGTRSHLGGCRLGGAPALTGCAGVNYFGPKGWGFRLSAGWAGARYVEPALLRRTERIARQAGVTPESFDAFTDQEQLEDAFTLDASLFKRFTLGRSQLTAALMLRNLTDDAAHYDGYESMRVRRLYAGDLLLFEPHATRYTYVYPRTFYLSVSYRF